jgi:hypothetical protein
MTQKNINRRWFLKESATVATAIGITPYLFSNEQSRNKIILSGSKQNDLYAVLTNCGIETQLVDSPLEAVTEAGNGDAVIVTAAGYPDTKTPLTQDFFDVITKKELRAYVEYPDWLPGQDVSDKILNGNLERGVVSSDFFGKQLPAMNLLGLNGVRLLPLKTEKPLISYAKVVGFNYAIYGLTDTDVYPLLFTQDNLLIAASCLTNFKTARYAPNDSWKIVWTKILEWLTGNKNITLTWQADPRPTYGEKEVLPADAGKNAIAKSTEWLFNARFLIHPTWLKQQLTYQGNGAMPVGPKIGDDKLVGDGSLGIIEGHFSAINCDGTQQYRYFMRCDVQGETSLLLATAGEFLDNEKYKLVAEKLIDNIFYTSNFRQGARGERNSASYGLLGGSNVSSHVFYNDDNARSVLGVLGASALLKNQRWNRPLTENIVANLRLSSKQGFIDGRIEEPQLLANGWKYYSDRDFVNPHPHYVSWMWACYLWLYDKTKYPLLLEKAKTAIQLTMDAYPENWSWTNGIQQERARMILPLAWLVRVEDTPQHREWLDKIVQELLKNQQPSGAIREELGNAEKGMFGKTRSNRGYGNTEATLITENGDPASDMLYTTNFAFFGLNEAAQATGKSEYKEAAKKLADFLIRLQVNSNQLDLNGAWFRAFDYQRWDYWGGNADAGWGAWATLTGWIQSWITATLMFTEKRTSYWELTQNMNMKEDLDASLWMLEK